MTEGTNTMATISEVEKLEPESQPYFTTPVVAEPETIIENRVGQLSLDPSTDSSFPILGREIKEFITFSESDADPEAPQISLELTVRPELYLDAPFSVWSTLRYDPPESEIEDRPVTILWSSSQPLLLLHQTRDGGFEKVDIEALQDTAPRDEDAVPKEEIAEISSYDPTETQSPLPLPYLRHLVVGETYILLFPGAEIPWWEFGGVGVDVGVNVKEKDGEAGRLTFGDVKRGKEGRKRIVVPAEHTVEFTVFEREEREEEFVPAQRLMRSNTVPSFRMSFHD